MRRLPLVMVLAASACSNVLDETPGVVFDAAPQHDALTFPDSPTLPALRIDFIDPDHGPFAGGTEVTLRGRGFVEGMTVTIGGRAVGGSDLEVIDGNRAIVTTPPGEPGDADLAIVAGDNQTTRAKAYLYEPIYVDPPSGGNAGGTYVRVRGLGTSFRESDVVTFGGQPMTGMVVVNGQELTGYTPPGISGAVDVRVAIAGGGELFAEDGYTYDAIVGTTYGGMTGGPIDGALNLRLVDAYTEDGIDMAVAVIGDPATSTLWGLTDPFGQLTLSGPGLRGPVTLTAGHLRYESGALVGFDARNVTMFLTPLPPDPDEIPPPPGPFPPGRAGGSVSGDVVFGGTTGIGTTSWDLVPEPETETARKRTYVFATAPNIFSSSADPGPGGTVDYVPGQSAWQYQIPVRPTAFALVAIAGLYEPDIDPDGSGPQPRGVFTPYAMGVQRNILVGPGEHLENVSIVVNIPLDTGLKVTLPDAPEVRPLDEDAGARGPDEYRVNVILDLGGEGVIRLPGSRAVFRGRRDTVLTALAPLAFAISDASYTIAAGAYTSGQAQPYSIRIVRGVRDLSRPVALGGFVGVPRAIDPPPDGVTAERHLVVKLDGGGAAPTLRDYRLVQYEDGRPVWRVLARGDLDEVPLYDLGRFGLPPMSDAELYFTAYAVHIPGATFDTFNYGLLNANYWAAYAHDTFTVSFARP